jgi:hypothetical protein
MVLFSVALIFNFFVDIKFSGNCLEEVECIHPSEMFTVVPDAQADKRSPVGHNLRSCCQLRSLFPFTAKEDSGTTSKTYEFINAAIHRLNRRGMGTIVISCKDYSIENIA